MDARAVIHARGEFAGAEAGITMVNADTPYVSVVACISGFDVSPFTFGRAGRGSLSSYLVSLAKTVYKLKLEPKAPTRRLKWGRLHMYDSRLPSPPRLSCIRGRPYSSSQSDAARPTTTYRGCSSIGAPCPA